jgi:protein-disulfide isomerase
MRSLEASLAVTFLLSFAQCARPEADEASKPAPVAAAPAAAPTTTAPARSKDDLGASAIRVPIDGLPSFGDPRALVTIVAFTDYECPYCAKADERLDALRAEYGDRVRLVVASHPLPVHENASPAARAFLAAVEQGKGEAMHAALFAKQTSPGGRLDDAGLREVATSVGLDMAAFDRARSGPSVDAAARRAQEIARSLGVDGTPTFFVNGRRLVGARPLDAFRALVDEEMAKAQALVDRGTPREALYAKIMEGAPPPAPPKAKLDDPPAVDVAIGDAPIRGDARAPVTIVLFSDFECPYCAKAEATLKAVEAARRGKVRVVFKHRPLPMHDHARLAARAAVAAEKQGRFWQYHDVLVAHRDSLDRASLEKYASDAGLSLLRFGRDLDDASVDARIAADEKQAEALGVKGTPTAFVNGRRITGAQPLATWLAEVDRALATPR